MKKFIYRTRLSYLCLLCGVALSCGPLPDYRTLVDVDLHPPQFLGALARDSRTVLLRFDETVLPVGGTVSMTPSLGVAAVHAEGRVLVVSLAVDQAVGVEYVIQASVEDERHNSTTVLTPFYGFNPDLPVVLINEFITQGSSNHPDLVELLAVEGGNSAGMCLYEGVSSNWDDRIVLPAIRLEAGDFVLVHFKPEGIPEEVDEIDEAALSGGLDASPTAYDLWVAEGSGLSGNNGVLSLYSCPGGEILDAVVYSNRTSSSDEAYAGFGSRDVYDRVCVIESANQWGHAGDHIAPEDAVDPEPSTATRSMCRGSDGADTDRSADWHVAPTSGSTFGEVNTDEVYVP